MSQKSGTEPDDAHSASKAPDAFRTISEVAAELDLPQHVLRFWETRFSQIKPLKRGGGRRYYRPQDVDLLRGIRHLLYGEGYTIRGVQRLLREQGLRFVIAASHGTIETAIMPEGEGATAQTAAGQRRSGAKRRVIDRRGAPETTSATSQSDQSASMSQDAVSQLQGTLAELLECKRILDAAR